MGLGLFDDIGRRAVRRQCFQYGIAQRIADARGQLTVRIRARAAFAKLDVAFGIQRAAAPKGIHRAVARVQIAAALQNQRFITVLASV